MKKTRYIAIFLLLGMTSLNAQMRMGGSTAPNPSAVLDLNPDEGDNATQGLALPRVKLISTNASSPLTAHLKGVYVYNTVQVNDVTTGVYYNNGIKWIRQSDLSETDVINLIKANSGNGIKTVEVIINGIIGTQSMIYYGTTNTSASQVQVLGIEPVFAGDRLVRMALITPDCSAQLDAAGTAIEWSVGVKNDNINASKGCTLHKVIISYMSDGNIAGGSLVQAYSLIGQ